MSFIHQHKIGNYPLCIAIADFIFYLPNFFKLRVCIRPTDFNQTITESLTSIMDNLMKDSKLLERPVPSFKSIYKLFFPVSMPYTTCNWGLRLGMYRQIDSLIIDKTQSEYSTFNIFSRFLSGGIAGALSSFITNPLLKLQISNQNNLVNSIKYNYKDVYNSAFLKASHKENRSSLLRRIRYYYQYSFIITLRGFIQGSLAYGCLYNVYIPDDDTYSSFKMRESVNKENAKESYGQISPEFLSSFNPLLERLKTSGYFKSRVASERGEYTNVLIGSMIAGFVVSIFTSHFDMVFHNGLSQSLINQADKFSIRAHFSEMRKQKIFGKNMIYLFIANTMRYTALLSISNFFEMHLYK